MNQPVFPRSRTCWRPAHGGVVLALLIQAGVAGLASANPALSVEGRTVEIRGAGAEVPVLLFGVSYEEMRYPRRISHRAAIFRTDRDGVFRLTVPEPIPTTSVWLAADPTTGEYAITVPAGYKLKKRELPFAALKRRGNGSRARVESGAHEQVLLLVRPGTGSWQGTGGPSLELAALSPVDDSPPPPDDFAAGDLLVMVDPTSLRVQTLRVR